MSFSVAAKLLNLVFSAPSSDSSSSFLPHLLSLDRTTTDHLGFFAQAHSLRQRLMVSVASFVLQPFFCQLKLLPSISISQTSGFPMQKTPRTLMSYNAEIFERILSIPFLWLQTRNHHHAPLHTLGTQDDRISSMPLCLDQSPHSPAFSHSHPLIQTQNFSSRTGISSAWRTSRTTPIPSATRPSLPLRISGVLFLTSIT